MTCSVWASSRKWVTSLLVTSSPHPATVSPTLVRNSLSWPPPSRCWRCCSLPNQGPFNESAYRGRQMQAGVAKHKCALQSGFFDATYRRIFEHEAESDPVRLERQYRIQQSKKNLGKAFLPCSGTKNPWEHRTLRGFLDWRIVSSICLVFVSSLVREDGSQAFSLHIDIDQERTCMVSGTRWHRFDWHWSRSQHHFYEF